MKYMKMGFRIWIAMSSVAGFLGGWALLAHSPKPAQPSQNPAQVELAPLPTLESNPSFGERNRGLQQLPAFQQSRRGSSRLRTGGS